MKIDLKIKYKYLLVNEHIYPHIYCNRIYIYRKKYANRYLFVIISMMQCKQKSCYKHQTFLDTWIPSQKLDTGQLTEPAGHVPGGLSGLVLDGHVGAHLHQPLQDMQVTITCSCDAGETMNLIRSPSWKIYLKYTS